MLAVPDPHWWQGRRVLVTGHTGFIGGWLALWLARMGARVSGLALPPPARPGFFESTGLDRRLAHHFIADLRDAPALERAVGQADPEVIFHLAAQALVREAHHDPLATFATNVQGTVHVLEACRKRASVGTLVAYTTDKVYRNDQSGRAFVESDPLGGNEPYSASKAGADWAIGGYWDAYFRARGAPRVAVVRAGNVIGGGDCAADRLLPDAMRAFSQTRPLVLRNPASTRPWQHVLDAVRGTLVLAERGCDARARAEDLAWNLGPAAGEVHAVSEVADAAVAAWGEGASWRHESDPSIGESTALVLSSERAARELGWRCRCNLREAVDASVAWYRAARGGLDLAALSEQQIEAHLADVARA